MVRFYYTDVILQSYGASIKMCYAPEVPLGQGVPCHPETQIQTVNTDISRLQKNKKACMNDKKMQKTVCGFEQVGYLVLH